MTKCPPVYQVDTNPAPNSNAGGHGRTLTAGPALPTAFRSGRDHERESGGNEEERNGAVMSRHLGIGTGNPPGGRSRARSWAAPFQPGVSTVCYIIPLISLVFLGCKTLWICRPLILAKKILGRNHLFPGLSFNLLSGATSDAATRRRRLTIFVEAR